MNVITIDRIHNLAVLKDPISDPEEALVKKSFVFQHRL